MTAASFFDRHPRFRETSRTDTRGHRLEFRHQMLIERNRDLLRGARVLDLASHDGRWTLAALDAGAAHVTGVEARAALIANAEANLSAYGASKGQYDFIEGDCLATLQRFEPGQFDVVLCFGFLYHTLEHFRLLQAITRLAPKAILIDTRLIESNAPAIMLGFDDSTLEGAAVPVLEGRTDVLVGFLTNRALDLIMNYLGWKVRYLDWHEAGFPDWEGVEDYRDRRRFTLVAEPKTGGNS
jgi:2-polyprenyl-3-methyl-5-hydroxy-6-metoxy-1,4-benzoquinol methylase